MHVEAAAMCLMTAPTLRGFRARLMQSSAYTPVPALRLPGGVGG